MLNRIDLMGRLTRDPELRRTQNGTACASFALAVDRDYTPEGAKRETDFINCVAWRNTAEFVNKYFAKGKLVAVTGRLQIRPYQDKDGNKRTATEVVVESAYFAGSAKEEAPAKKEDFAQLTDDETELPF